MDIRQYLLDQHTQTYDAWYAGLVRYEMASRQWQKYVDSAFSREARTSENMFASIVDIFADALMPKPTSLRFLADSLTATVMRGEGVMVRTQDEQLLCPQTFELVHEGMDTIAAVFTRSLLEGKDYCTFVWSSGHLEVWSKPTPDDLSPADRVGYTFEAEERATLYYYSLGLYGLGNRLAPLQDRLNHCLVDKAIISEMYSRPFWYLLNHEEPVANPYLQGGQTPTKGDEPTLSKNVARVFTTSGPGPFGQLQPPDLTHLQAEHDSVVKSFAQLAGVPQFFLEQSGTPPTGIALQQLMSRFTKKVARMRQYLTPTLEAVLTDQGEVELIDELWSSEDDLMQQLLDDHGMSLKTMGYPLDYIASVVTPDAELSQLTPSDMEL